MRCQVIVQVLTIVPSINCGQEPLFTFHQVDKFGHQIPTFRWREFFPAGILPSLPGCVDGFVDIIDSGSLDFHNLEFGAVGSQQ